MKRRSGLTSMVLLLGLLISAPAWPHPWRDLYGDRLLFDVYRGGDLVGQYETQFRGQADQWRVEALMEVEVPWMFWNYRYRYRGLEEWQGGRLQSLRVWIDRNGEERSYHYQLRGDWLVDQRGERVAAPVLPTHHYDMRILSQDRLLNTLKGREIEVDASAQGRESLFAGGLMISASRFHYGGELEGTQVWYDDRGRWVGLRFLDDRGSEVELRCRHCGQGVRF